MNTMKRPSLKDLILSYHDDCYNLPAPPTADLAGQSQEVIGHGALFLIKADSKVA